MLTETTWVLDSYSSSAREIATAVEMLLEHDRLTVQDADVVSAAVAQMRKKPSLGFPDRLILEVAPKTGHIPLGTFNRRLGQLAHVEPL